MLQQPGPSSSILHAGTSSLSVTDEGKGSYSASYTPKKAGFVTLRTLVNGEVLGQPRTVPVLPAAVSELHPLSSGPWTCIAGTSGGGSPRARVDQTYFQDVTSLVWNAIKAHCEWWSSGISLGREGWR